MKQIRVLRNAHHFSYPGDVERIVRAMADCGYECSEVDAHWMWDEYSSDMCAGWMTVPDNSELIVKAIRSKFDPVRAGLTEQNND